MSTRVVDLFRSGKSSPEAETPYQKAKRELHAEVVSSLDLKAVQSVPREELERQLRETLTRMVRARQLPMTRDEQSRVVGDILDEVLGFGPLEKLLRMNDVSDILVNGSQTIFVERRGQLELTDIKFRDDEHLMHIINRIVGRVGRRIDESNPMVDARLPDGSRFNAIVPPAALDGPSVSIRRFGVTPIRRNDLVQYGSVPEPIMKLLEGCVHAGLNVLISGGTGSGKTTLLNVLSSFIPAKERIVTIEDAAELQLQQTHVVRLETRPPNLEGSGEITPRSLVKNALRMRPDRIAVGEIRGEECIDMLQAMNTGHDGSLSTVHANSPRHALSRLQTMAGLSLGNMPAAAIQEMIADAIHVIVQVNRLSDGHRRLMSLTEVVGMQGGVIASQEIFKFEQRTVDASGKVRGTFRSSGVRPQFARRLEAHGFPVPQAALNFRMDV
jgi:pilus assembly protein CpaF